MSQTECIEQHAFIFHSSYAKGLYQGVLGADSIERPLSVLQIAIFLLCFVIGKKNKGVFL